MSEEDDCEDWSVEAELDALVEALEDEDEGSQAVQHNAQIARSAEMASVKAEREILFIGYLSSMNRIKYESYLIETGN